MPYFNLHVDQITVPISASAVFMIATGMLYICIKTLTMICNIHSFLSTAFASAPSSVVSNRRCSSLLNSLFKDSTIPQKEHCQEKCTVRITGMQLPQLLDKRESCTLLILCRFLKGMYTGSCTVEDYPWSLHARCYKSFRILHG